MKTMNFVEYIVYQIFRFIWNRKFRKNIKLFQYFLAHQLLWLKEKNKINSDFENFLRSLLDE